MPFKSQAQARFLWAKHPEIAKRWENEYHQKISQLPGHNAKKPAKKKKRK